MSPEKPPRLPRTPRRTGRTGSAAALGVGGVPPNIDNLQAWSQLAQARSQLEDGLVVEAAAAAEALLNALSSSANEEEFALKGSAAAVLGIALAAQEDAQAHSRLELAVEDLEQAPAWTSRRKDVAADWGLALAGLGRFAEAVPVLEGVLPDPHEATPLVRRTLAGALAEIGRADQAIEILAGAVELAPSDGEAHLFLAELLEQTGSPPGRRAAAWTAAGEALLATEKMEQAVSAAKRAVRIEPTGMNLDLLGRASSWVGDYEGAVAAFKRADELAPTAAVRINLADALAELGAEEEAAQAAMSAVVLRPDDRELLASAAAHLLAANRLDDLDQAIEQLAAADGALAAGYRGVAAFRRGLPSLASTELGAAMYEPPDDPRLLWVMAEVMNNLAQPDLALRALDRLIDVDPGKGEGKGRALAQRGVVLVSLDRLDEGVRDIRASLQFGSYPESNAYLGEALASTGRFDEAVVELRQAIDQGFDEIWALVAYGQALRGLQQDDEAEGVFRLAFERAPTDVDAIVGLASVHLDKFDAEADLEAGQMVEYGLGIHPDSAILLALRGELLRRVGGLDEAIGYFERALEVIPDWPWARGSLAQTLRLRSAETGAVADLERAEQLVEAALSAAPNEPFLHSELAEVAVRQKRWLKAHEHLEAAFGLGGFESGYLVRRGELYLETKEPQQARECFERAMEVRRDYPGLRTLLADVLAGQDELTAAAALLDEALTADPDDADARYARFTLRWNADRWQEATEDLDQLPEWDELVSPRADVLRQQGRYDEALEMLDVLLANQPDEETALMVRGAVYLARGRTTEARRDLERAVELAPHEPFAQDQLDDLLVAIGQAEQALANVEERLSASPGDGSLRLRRAVLLTRCGRPEEAAEDLEKDLWGKLDDPLWLATLGWALVACERYQEGIDYLARSAGLQPDSLLPLLNQSAAELEVAPHQAHVSANRAIEVAPGEPGGWIARSRVESACGDFDAAAKSAATATACWSQLAGAYSQLGWALHHTTQDQAAERAYDAYRRSRELDALDPWTVSGEGSTLYSLGRREESEERYLACLRLLDMRRDPEVYAIGLENRRSSVGTAAGLEKRRSSVASAAGLRGWCLFRLGRYDEAWSPALRAVNLATRPAGFLFDLSLIAAARGRGEEAQSLVVRAAEEARREHPQFQIGTLAVARFDLHQLQDELSPEVLQMMRHVHSKLED